MKSVLGSSSLSSMKDLTTAILSSAIGIMAGYSNVASADAAEHSRLPAIEQSQENIEIANYLHELVKDCNEMETGYRQLVKTLLKLSSEEVAGILTRAEMEEYSVKLRELRNIETLLKNAEVPPQFQELHLSARKALAKGRTWVVAVHDVTLQAMQEPVIVDGSADPDGLKALADHSTKKVIELARA
ncbi:hypothetical protein [Pseudomonas sp. SMV7]|uniref:hypothetical protein n=1 Tax=Pseudomonas sp. SMV7 TaxID=3390194 RepID=UPI003F87B6FC